MPDKHLAYPRKIRGYIHVRHSSDTFEIQGIKTDSIKLSLYGRVWNKHFSPTPLNDIDRRNPIKIDFYSPLYFWIGVNADMTAEDIGAVAVGNIIISIRRKYWFGCRKETYTI